MGIKEYTNWNKRPSDNEEQKNPFRKYYVICEGANTEQYYFKHLIDNRKALDIKSTIDIRLLEKDGEDRSISYPLELIQFAEIQKRNGSISFDKKYDRMIVVFDADIFEYRSNKYSEIVETGEAGGNILGVSNPSFELFLLLHLEDAVETIIIPFEEEFLKKENLHANGFAATKLRELTGMNPKRNPQIGELADRVLFAIDEEKKINQDIHECKGNVTSNIGAIIQMIIDDDGSE